MPWAILTDSKGNATLGSDGKIWVDRRHGIERSRQAAMTYREGFRKHFPGKFKSWTHYGIVDKLSQDPKVVYSID